MISLPGRINARDILLRDLGLVRAGAPFAFDNFHAAIEAARNDVPIMQERILLKTDIHEGGFEAVFEIAHFAFENAADEAFLGGALDVEFFELAFFENADARLERLGVDDDFFVNPFYRLDQALNFFDQGWWRRRGCYPQCPWAVPGTAPARMAFLPAPRREFPCWVRGNWLCRHRTVRPVRGGAFGRQAGGDIFGALDFLRVAMIVNLFRRRRAADGFGAGLGGVAVGALRLAVSQPAAGAETHSAAPAPEKFLSLIVNRPFDRYKRFATCPWRSTSPALMTRRNISSGSGMPVTGTMRIFMPILMNTWLNNRVDNAHSHQLAQAIARLAGDSDSGEQDHAVQRQHDNAADESFLLGNDGENEIIMRRAGRQKTQSGLVALMPAFAPKPARADRDQRLAHLVGIFRVPVRLL